MMPIPTILIVDDDEGHRQIARRAIAAARLPAEVRVAADGAEALRLLGLAPDAMPPDPPASVLVVLLDLGLPDIAGWEILRRMRASDRTRDIPVVVVSSSNRAVDVRRSYELGANSYVQKRSDATRPGAYLADVARYWAGLNVPPPTRAESAARGKVC